MHSPDGKKRGGAGAVSLGGPLVMQVVMYLMEKMQTILKCIVTLFLIKAVSNYKLMMAIPNINVGFWSQYIGIAGILAYFASALASCYGVFSRKKWRFISIYSFIILACFLASPVFPIPVKFIPQQWQIFFIFALNIVCLLCVIWLQTLQRRYYRVSG